MKHFLTIVLVSVGLLIAGSPVTAQKFGYINADDIFLLMPEIPEIQKQLEDFQQSLIKNSQDKQNAFQTAVDKFTADSATMSESLKEIKRNELVQQSQELSNQQQINQQRFQGKQQELIAPVQKKLQDAIEEVAKENGYAFIFRREDLLVVPEAGDIGPLVMKKLNLKAPAPAANPATPAAPGK